eukprot:2748103-Prymnesium_polylepis.4
MATGSHARQVTLALPLPPLQMSRHSGRDRPTGRVPYRFERATRLERPRLRAACDSIGRTVAAVRHARLCYLFAPFCAESSQPHWQASRAAQHTRTDHLSPSESHGAAAPLSPVPPRGAASAPPGLP